MSLSSASAQTRARRAAAKPEKERAGASQQPVKRVSMTTPALNAATTRPPLVRKTAMTRAVGPGNPNTTRPTLANDIVIISVADEKPSDSVPRPTAMNANAGRATLNANAGRANTPSIWPVAGQMRSGFGMRGNPFGGSSTEFHKGQDISAPSGTPVVATADGIVVRAEWARGYGQVVYIDHGNGIETRYGHLSRIDVAVGQQIRRGEQLGLVGSTGRSTGPHLHYEVLINGEKTNPLLYLPSASPLGTK